MTKTYDRLPVDGFRPSISTTSKVMLVTPSMAAAWIKECPYSGQRKLRLDRVTLLAEAMISGDFEVSTIKFHRHVPSDRRFLTDGQHRLHGIVESGTPQTLIVVDVPVWDESEIEKAYWRTDIGRRRTPAEVSSLGTGLSLTDSQIKAARAGLAGLCIGFEYSSKASKLWLARWTVADSLTLIRDWESETIRYFESLTGKSLMTRMMRLHSVTLGLGLLTFRYQPEKAKEFWGGVSDASRLDPTDARSCCAALILDMGAAASMKKYHARRVSLCWNAFIEERPLTKAIVKDPSRPIQLHGVPRFPWITS